MKQTAQFDDFEIRRAVRVLKNIEPDSLKQLKAEMSMKLMPFANEVAATLPAQAPLSGLAKSPGYGVSKGNVKTDTSGRKRSGNSIVRITVKSTRANKTKGLLLAEFAGTKSRGYSKRGKALIRNLNNVQRIRGKGGRFSYPYVRSQRPRIVKIASGILDNYMKKASRFI